MPPLGVPAEPGTPTAAAIADREAVVLFVDRPGCATRVRTHRRQRAGDRGDLPSSRRPAARARAAAARINLLSPEQILARLDHRLTLLASTRRDLPDRQRTLRGAIDWSHDLLNDPERRLFRRLAVFSSGADLEAVEAVIDPDGSVGGDVLDLAAALVDRSLLRSREVGDRNRLEMLETIREYAAEQLLNAGEADTIGAAHAAYFASLAELELDALMQPDGQALFDRLENELPNARAAIAFVLRTGDTDTSARIGTGLREFWHSRNHLQDGRAVLDQILAATADEGPTLLRARVVATASELASWHGDWPASYRLAVEAVEVATVVGEPYEIAVARIGLGWASFMQAPEAALAEFEAALELRQGHPVIAAGSFAAAVRLAQETGGLNALGIALDGMAGLAILRDGVVDAVRLSSVASRLREELGGGLTLAMLGEQATPLDTAAVLLSPDAFARAADAGRGLSVDEAVALALEIADGWTTGD